MCIRERYESHACWACWVGLPCHTLGVSLVARVVGLRVAVFTLSPVWCASMCRAAQVVFVHCLGGHGRTGTVVISLLAALANMDNHTARKHVVAYHNQRERCRGSTWCRLPEVRSQDAQVRAVNPAMRRHYMKDKLAGKKK